MTWAWASESAAAKQAEDYTILSSNTCSRSSNVSVLIKEGVFFLLEKVSVFF